MCVCVRVIVFLQIERHMYMRESLSQNRKICVFVKVCLFCWIRKICLCVNPFLGVGSYVSMWEFLSLPFPFIIPHVSLFSCNRHLPFAH